MRELAIRTACLAVLVACAAQAEAAWAQQTPSIPTLSADQVGCLEAGEILVEVVNGEVTISDTIGVVHGSPAQVLEIIEDYEHYPEFMPDTSEAEIVSREDEYVLWRGVTDTPWPMQDREWTVRSWSGPQHIDGLEVLVNTWDYVPGSGNVVDTEGYWLLIPWGESSSSTLVRYYLTADLGTWVPDGVISWASEGMLPGYIEAIRGRLGHQEEPEPGSP